MTVRQSGIENKGLTCGEMRRHDKAKEFLESAFIGWRVRTLYCDCIVHSHSVDVGCFFAFTGGSVENSVERKNGDL